jgi:hypothetical protein
VSVDQAARLAAVSPATVRSWIRRGAVPARATGGQTAVGLEDVVRRAVARGRPVDRAALESQADAALAELADMAGALAQVEDQYARREEWARGQHEREMHEIYARWEQERSRWEHERAELADDLTSAAARPPAAEAVPVPVPAQVTSRRPISDELLPPLHADPTPHPAPNGNITPDDRSRSRWRQLRA